MILAGAGVGALLLQVHIGVGMGVAGGLTLLVALTGHLLRARRAELAAAAGAAAAEGGGGRVDRSRDEVGTGSGDRLHGRRRRRPARLGRPVGEDLTEADDGVISTPAGPPPLLLGSVARALRTVELGDDLVAAAPAVRMTKAATEALLVDRAFLGQGLDELRVVVPVGGGPRRRPELLGAASPWRARRRGRAARAPRRPRRG